MNIGSEAGRSQELAIGGEGHAGCTRLCEPADFLSGRQIPHVDCFALTTRHELAVRRESNMSLILASGELTQQFSRCEIPNANLLCARIIVGDEHLAIRCQQKIIDPPDAPET